MGTIEDEEFLPLPESKANHAKFPPGCRVICCEQYSDQSATDCSGGQSAVPSSLIFHLGRVERIGINLDSSSRENVYKIQPIIGHFWKTGTSENEEEQQQQQLNVMFAEEEHLQFAPRTFVWLDIPDEETQKAVVLFSEHNSALPTKSDKDKLSTLRYCVQSTDSRKQIFRDVSPGRLKYRLAGGLQLPKDLSEKKTGIIQTSSSLVHKEPLKNISETKTAFPSPVTPEFANKHDSSNADSPTATIKEVTKAEVANVEILKTGGTRGKRLSDEEMKLLKNDTSRSEESNKGLPGPKNSSDANSKKDVPEEEPSAKSLEQQSGNVINPYPCPFRKFKRSSTNHTGRVLSALRKYFASSDPNYDPHDAYNGVGPLIVNRCLHWHLSGKCKVNCHRSSDHVQLSDEEARDLEHALSPAVYEGGPLQLRSDCSSSSSSSSSSSQKRLKWSPPETLAPGKRQRLSRHHNMKEVSASQLDGPAQYTLCLPCSFGVGFIKWTIIGRKGRTAQELCSRFRLKRLEIGGTLLPKDMPYYAGSEPLFVNLIPKSGCNFEDCSVEIESILLGAVPKEVRVALLFNLASSNQLSSRRKRGHIVESRNPFVSSSSRTSDLHWMTIIKAGRRTEPDLTVLGLGDIYQYLQQLQGRYPSCRIGVVETCEAHPKVLPHVYITGPKHTDVYSCRKDLLTAVCGRR